MNAAQTTEKQVNIEQLAEKLKAAKTINSGNYVNPNTRGVVVVKSTKMQNGYKGSSAIFEFEILESEGKAAQEGVSEGKAHKKGEEFSVVLNLSGGGVKEDMGYNNLKTNMAAIAAALRLPDPINDGIGLAKAAFTADGKPSAICRGVKLAYDTLNKPPKDGKPARSFPKFSPIPQTDEDLEAMKADLDKRKPL